MGFIGETNLNPAALVWSLLSLPVNALVDAREVWQDRQALRRNGFLSALSRRYLERAIGRFGMLTIIMLVGLASLHTPFAWPTTPRGWILLISFYVIPIY